MRSTPRALHDRGVGADASRLSGAQHEVRGRSVRPLPARRALPLRRRPGAPLRPAEPLPPGRSCERHGQAEARRWKFASCDGCQLTLLNCEDELLALAGQVEIAYFLEATRADVEGPTTSPSWRARSPPPDDARADPARSARSLGPLITIGACATAGGIQALRNFADVDEFRSVVYAQPGVHLDARTVDPDRRARVGRLRAARLPDRQGPAVGGARGPARRRAARDPHAQRLLSSASGAGTCASWSPTARPCLGPVTQAGCGALCPSFDRGCYGCFGPMDTPNCRLAVELRHARHGRRPGARVFRDLQRRLRGVRRSRRRRPRTARA